MSEVEVTGTIADKLEPCRYCAATPDIVPINVNYRSDNWNGLRPMWRARCACGAIGKCRPSPEEAAQSWAIPWQARIEEEAFDRPATPPQSPAAGDMKQRRAAAMRALNKLNSHLSCDIYDYINRLEALSASPPSEGVENVVYAKYHMQLEYVNKNGAREWLDTTGGIDDLDWLRKCVRLHNSRKLPAWRTGNTRIVNKVITDTVIEESMSDEALARLAPQGES